MSRTKLLLIAAGLLLTGNLSWLGWSIYAKIPPASPTVECRTCTVPQEKKGALGFPLHTERELGQLIAAGELDAGNVIDGLIKLLQTGSPERKRQLARILEENDDRRAVAALLVALDDPDAEVRLAVCRTLYIHRQRSGLRFEGAEATLRRIRTSDPSTGVRVIAAILLGQPKDLEAIAAFRAGLASSDPWIRWESEEALDRQGMLELPLPEHVYWEISPARYQELRKEWVQKYKLHRMVRKGGKVYFEYDLYGYHSGDPTVRYWYCMDDSEAEAQKT